MKKILIFLMMNLIFMTGCGEVQETSAEKNLQVDDFQIKIQIGEKIFDVILENNSSTQEFIKKLPLEVTMNELNGNEKYFRFDKNFPSADEKISEIQSGDIMLWSSNTIVLFYKNFSTSYRYTRLGKIKNPDNLAEIVGEKNISVKFFK